MSWSDILGQDSAIRALRSGLSIAHPAQAYLLAGPEGVGKRRLALEMAKALNCLSEGERPCDTCRVCAPIGRLAHPDVHLLLPGGASDQIKIEEVRHLLGRVALRPFSARMQVALIDGAERLTEEAANSLLKTLEEPSGSTRFLLTSARLSDCLPTIVSRCRIVRCQPLSFEIVERLLTEKQLCDPSRAKAIAAAAGGSAARAIDLAGRWMAHEKLCARLGADSPTVAWMEEPLPETRQEVALFLESLMVWLRDVALLHVSGLASIAYASQRKAIEKQACRVDIRRCVETALEFIRLRDSVQEQFVSPRLVAALAREKWLSLASGEPPVRG